MIIYGIYFIRNDGLLILSEYFQSIKTLPNELLLGGLFTALQGVASEMTNGKFLIKTVVTEGLSFHVKSFPFYRIVLITDLSELQEFKQSETIMQKIGSKFTHKFRNQLQKDVVKPSNFESFLETIHEDFIEKNLIDTAKLIDPTKLLDANNIMSLPPDLQPTAKAMLVSQNDFTIQEIALITQENEKKVKININNLQELGYVGQKLNQKNYTYFILR